MEASGPQISACIGITHPEGLLKQIAGAPPREFLIQEGWGEAQEFVLSNKFPADAGADGTRLRTVGLEQEEDLCN